ncbi:hypothetical protein [Acrocarpospora sp. B8E8]|uniref:hypothetical protein n=1 Tax=Acrocarpospora sp. B8E8 TaxID=3153572 RepID=UPI00325C8DD4
MWLQYAYGQTQQDDFRHRVALRTGVLIGVPTKAACGQIVLIKHRGDACMPWDPDDEEACPVCRETPLP